MGVVRFFAYSRMAGLASHARLLINGRKGAGMDDFTGGRRYLHRLVIVVVAVLTGCGPWLKSSREVQGTEREFTNNTASVAMDLPVMGWALISKT